MSKYHLTIPTPFKTITIIWEEVDARVLVEYIFLSTPKSPSTTRAKTAFPKTQPGNSPIINELVNKIQRFLAGNPVNFDLTLLNWQPCSSTQQRVLIAEANIPRGYVSTYQRIANHLGIKNGARIVGNALARNPFPIIIPCHRAIRSDGSLGGYRGGIAMKRTLLESEKIRFTPSGKVIMDRVHY